MECPPLFFIIYFAELGITIIVFALGFEEYTNQFRQLSEVAARYTENFDERRA